MMFHKRFQRVLAFAIVIAHIMLMSGTGYAEAPSVKLIINPNKTDVSLGSEPIALTAKATGANLTYSWSLQGPGNIDGQGSAVFYVLPKTVKGKSEQALVTVTITDESGQETTETITFNILSNKMTSSPAPAAEKKGMSQTTKIALGVGAAAALGGALAIVGGGDDSSDGGGTLDVYGQWEFSGQLTQNGCDYSAVSSMGGTLTFFQSGSTVETGDITLNIINEATLYFWYSGNISGSNLNLAAVDPYVYRRGGTVIHIGSGLEIQNISDNAGTGSFNLTSDCIQGCSGSCQTVWSGNWTRVSW